MQNQNNIFNMITSSYSLTPKIAQQIVDRTMKIIDCNINVMDANGCIIGSGDLERIGEVHEGAMLAISQKRIVSIDGTMVRGLQGVKPGINLPLKLNDHIVGVIGLTGEPSDIRQFGELVCMSAEMMMEQTQLLQELSYDNRLKEELILTLIEKEILPDSMVQWVKRLDIDLNLPRVVGIVEVDSGQLGIDTAMSELQNLQTQVQILSKYNLVAIKSITELVILIPALNRYGRWDLLEHKKKLEQLVIDIKNTTQLDIRISLGNYFDQHPYPLVKSYQTAKTTMLIGKQRIPNLRNYYYQQLILPVLLHGLSYDWQAEELLLPLKKLRMGDNNGTLQKTLQTWFKNNLHNGNTANELFIHRNTLEYRLNKVAGITGLNLDKFDDKLLLYIALQLDRN